MKDHGILFKPFLAQRVYDRLKCHTRRLLKNPEYFGCPTGDCPHHTQSECNAAMNALSPEEIGYAAGDTFWVRETHYAFGKWHQSGLTKTGKPKFLFELDDGPTCIRFKPHGGIFRQGHRPQLEAPILHQRSALFLPRKYARTTGIIADVRVEMLKDISEADAVAEGVEETQRGYWKDYGSNPLQYGSARESFRSLWDSINGEKLGARWCDNPWVVVLRLERSAA